MVYNIKCILYGDVFGFDNLIEAWIASGGLLLGHLNNVGKQNKRW